MNDHMIPAVEKESKELYILSDEDRKFLSIAHNKNIRKVLLERLRDLGELPAFLEAENGRVNK